MVALPLPGISLFLNGAAMAEPEEKNRSVTNHDVPQPHEEESDIIPGRHGKHGGSLESEGAPQDESREANPPRKADDTASGR
jgi:hypothetical protein